MRLRSLLGFLPLLAIACATDPASPEVCVDCATPSGKADAFAPLDWDHGALHDDHPPLAATMPFDVFLRTEVYANHPVTSSPRWRSAFFAGGEGYDAPPGDGRVTCVLLGHGSNADAMATAGGPLRVTGVAIDFIRNVGSSDEVLSGTELYFASNPQNVRSLLCSTGPEGRYATYRQIQEAVAGVVDLQELGAASGEAIEITSQPASYDEASHECNRIGYRVPSRTELEIRGEAALAGLPQGACAYAYDFGRNAVLSAVRWSEGALSSEPLTWNEARSCHAVCEREIATVMEWGEHRQRIQSALFTAFDRLLGAERSLQNEHGMVRVTDAQYVDGDFDGPVYLDVSYTNEAGDSCAKIRTLLFNGRAADPYETAATPPTVELIDCQ